MQQSHDNLKFLGSSFTFEFEAVLKKKEKNKLCATMNTNIFLFEYKNLL